MNNYIRESRVNMLYSVSPLSALVRRMAIVKSSDQIKLFKKRLDASRMSYKDTLKFIMMV